MYRGARSSILENAIFESKDLFVSFERNMREVRNIQKDRCPQTRIAKKNKRDERCNVNGRRKSNVPNGTTTWQTRETKGHTLYLYVYTFISVYIFAYTNLIRTRLDCITRCSLQYTRTKKFLERSIYIKVKHFVGWLFQSKELATNIVIFVVTHSTLNWIFTITLEVRND